MRLKLIVGISAEPNKIIYTLFQQTENMEMEQRQSPKKRADKIEHTDEQPRVIAFDEIDIVMMSMLLLLLFSTNALELQLSAEIKRVLDIPGVTVMISIAFIFFTIVWTQGHRNISPWESMWLSLALFVMFMLITRIPKQYFFTVIVLLVIYFIVHHMQVYRATITEIDVRKRTLIEHATFAISHKTHDLLMSIIFYSTLLVIAVGFVHQFQRVRVSMPVSKRRIVPIVKKLFS